MKKSIIRYLLLLVILAPILITCNQDDQIAKEITLPEVVTKSVQTYIDDMIYVCLSGGTIISDGGSKITESGICWSTHPLPTIQDNKAMCTSPFYDRVTVRPSPNLCDNDFLCNLTSWKFRNRYYVRAYAKNRLGIAYGNEVSFTTWCKPISWNFVPNKLALNSPINGATGQSTNLTLKWSSISLTYDVYFGTSQNPTTKIATNKSSDTLNLRNLDAATTYYWKVKVWDTIGLCPVDSTAIWHFTTVESINTASVSTSSDSIFTSTGAVVGGKVTSDGGAIITERGVYWGPLPNPEITGTRIQIGSGTGEFSTTLTGLSPNTKYYQKAYAVNRSGTGYGSQVSFYTGAAIENNTISDIEGNTYHIKLIGSQVWMTENLKTTKYPDGSSIPLVTEQTDWGLLSPNSIAYCWYNNNIANKDLYGSLYTWTAATKGVASNSTPGKVQGVCPTGWHLPSMPEWELLVEYLGGENAAANKMKESGDLHWKIPPNSSGFSPNVSTNESGFTALPGGYRDGRGVFSTSGIEGYWWSSFHETYRQINASMFTIENRGIRYNSQEKIFGCSVRCLRD
jgi:uncharacterized protein (TIGR02145 family)